jgi:hypothetical protein
MKSHLIVVFAVLAFAGCDSGAAVTVRNESAHALKSVKILGSCFRTPVEDIAPASSASYRLSPPCESGIGLEFEAAGRRVATAPEGYFEGSSQYVVDVEVTPDLTVTVQTNLAFAPDTSRE